MVCDSCWQSVPVADGSRIERVLVGVVCCLELAEALRSSCALVVWLDEVWTDVNNAMLDLKQHSYSVYVSSVLEGFPAKALHHRCHTSRCTFPVISVDKPGGSTLYLLQVVGISDQVGVPYGGGIFNPWSHHCSVGGRLHCRGAVAQVPPDKTKCLVGLASRRVDVLLPAEVLADGDS